MDENQPPAQEPTKMTEEPVETPATETAAQESQEQPELPKKFTGEAKTIGSAIPGKLDQLKTFIIECKRVIRVTKKPDRQEFTTIVKISAIGMAVIGLIGFAVQFLKQILL